MSQKAKGSAAEPKKATSNNKKLSARESGIARVREFITEHSDEVVRLFDKGVKTTSIINKMNEVSNGNNKRFVKCALILSGKLSAANVADPAIGALQAIVQHEKAKKVGKKDA